MKIALDAMGGDKAPARIVDGAVLAAKQYATEGLKDTIVLIGDEQQIKTVLKECDGLGYLDQHLEIFQADEVIDMDESPTTALKAKPNSTIHVGTKLQKEGGVDGFVSMGNTGAVMAVSLMGLGRIEGVSRPTIGAFFPRVGGFTLVLDVGAMIDAKPSNLLQFGIMGSIYSTLILERESPRVGLLNIGEEDSKGGETYVEAHQLMREKNVFNFIGNVEGRDILKDTADVIICDGFVGNVALKMTESFVGFVAARLKKVLENPKVRSAFRENTEVIKFVLTEVLRGFDYQEYGGVPLLGVNGVVIIGHGSSSPKAVQNAIMSARRMVEKGVNERIKEQLMQATSA